MLHKHAACLANLTDQTTWMLFGRSMHLSPAQWLADDALAAIGGMEGCHDRHLQIEDRNKSAGEDCRGNMRSIS